MKKLFVIAIAVCALSACSSNWEYKIVSVDGTETTNYNPKSFTVTDKDLNLFGQKGWELVEVYTINETVHPNFGNSDYVTGIRENTRTQSINYVFKRKK